MVRSQQWKPRSDPKMNGNDHFGRKVLNSVYCSLFPHCHWQAIRRYGHKGYKQLKAIADCLHKGAVIGIACEINLLVFTLKYKAGCNGSMPRGHSRYLQVPKLPAFPYIEADHILCPLSLC